MAEWNAALQAGTIILREGPEALLVIAALAAFLTRAGHVERVSALAAGAAAALLASVAAAIAFERLLGGSHDDRLEAVVMIVAAVLMLTMSGWLFARRDPRRWRAALARTAEAAAAAPGPMALAAVAFLAVFREGAETMLFVHALALSAGGWGGAIFAGIAVAAVLLAVLWFALRRLALRLPLKPVFVATSALLFLMGVRFAGGAVQELQELGLVGLTDMPGAARLEAIGLGGTVEASAAEAGLALLCLGSWLAARPAAVPARSGA